MLDKIMRAVRLDSTFYEEVEKDETQTGPALMVVGAIALITALASGLAAGIWSLVGFFIWAGIVMLVGTRLLGGKSNMGEVIRTMGFAYAPLLLGALQFIPLLGWILALAGAIWAIVAMVIATRQAMDFSTGKAVATILLGALAYMLGSAALAAIFA